MTGIFLFLALQSLTTLAEQADCQMKTDPQHIQIEGTFPDTFYKLSGNICYDSRCFGTNPKIDVHVNETIHESVACFKKLAEISLAPLIEKAIRGEPMKAEEIERIRQSVPARTAIQLSSIDHLEGRFADFFNENEQNWMFVNPSNLQITNATKRFIESSLKDPYPLRISCFPLTTKFNYSRKIGQVLITEPIDLIPSFKTVAEASSPGMPSWPSVSFHPIGFSMKSHDTQAIHSILLHEFMHLLGYTHVTAQLSEPGTRITLPLFSACQVCCFPEGLRERQLARPACNSKEKGSLFALACSVCAGDKSVADFQKIKQAYDKKMDQCYQIGNSL